MPAAKGLGLSVTGNITMADGAPLSVASSSGAAMVELAIVKNATSVKMPSLQIHRFRNLAFSMYLSLVKMRFSNSNETHKQNHVYNCTLRCKSILASTNSYWDFS